MLAWGSCAGGHGKDWGGGCRQARSDHGTPQFHAPLRVGITGHLRHPSTPDRPALCLWHAKLCPSNVGPRCDKRYPKDKSRAHRTAGIGVPDSGRASWHLHPQRSYPPPWPRPSQARPDFHRPARTKRVDRADQAWSLCGHPPLVWSIAHAPNPRVPCRHGTRQARGDCVLLGDELPRPHRPTPTTGVYRDQSQGSSTGQGLAGCHIQDHLPPAGAFLW